MNDHKARQAQMQAASRQFLNALSAGQAGARDRFNNIIEPGQKLLYKTPFDLMFEVVAVAPVLDPNVPPGMMDVTLAVRFPLRVMANQPNPGAVIVAQVQPEEKPATEQSPEQAQEKLKATLADVEAEEERIILP